LIRFPENPSGNKMASSVSSSTREKMKRRAIIHNVKSANITLKNIGPTERIPPTCIAQWSKISEMPILKMTANHTPGHGKS
jgi:hypothetical protein